MNRTSKQHGIDVNNDLDRDIADILEAYEGPEYPVAGLRPRHSQRYVIAVVSGLVLALAGLAGIRWATESQSPTTAPARGANAQYGLIDLAYNVDHADLIFIGDVVQTPTSSGDNSAPAVEYNVEQVLKGDPTLTASLRYYPQAEDEYPVELGKRYLVFADWEKLGPDGAPMLYPVGGPQSVYQVGTDGTAIRADGDRLQIAQLVQTVNSAASSETTSTSD